MRGRRAIKRKEMLRHIPAYPGACSLLNLGAHLGYVSKDMEPAVVTDVLGKMEKRLFWTVVGNRRLVGAEMRTQRSTRLALTGLGFSGENLPKTCLYLSIDPGDGDA